LLAAASLYFFLFRWLGLGTAPVNTQAIGWISLFPAAVGILGWLQRPSRRRPASKLAAAIIISLSVFSLVVDGYLLYLVFLSRARGG
jgi:hypothetical protein